MTYEKKWTLSNHLTPLALLVGLTLTFSGSRLPAATTDGKPTLAPELTVTSNTPPTLLIQTEDDGVHVENSLVYYLALKNAHVPAEMHLFSQGGHGYGLRPSGKPVTTWPRLAEGWLRSREIITPRQ